MLGLIFAVLLGALVALAIKLNKAKVVQGFSWPQFFKLNWLATLVNIVIGVCAVIFRKDVAETFPITFVSSFVLGAAGQFVLKGLLDAVSPNVSTYIGLNSPQNGTP